MTGTFTKKTRVYSSNRFISPLAGRKDFDETALAFLESIATANKTLTLDANYAIKAAMGGGLGPSIAGNSGDSDGKKRVNKGGTPGMEEPEPGYRLMPNEKMGPGKVLKMFPSQESQRSADRTPNFGFIDKKPQLTPDQQIAMLMAKPIPRMEKYRVNPRNGEPIEGSYEKINPFAWGKTMPIDSPVEEKSLGGNTIGRTMRGSGLIARTAAKFGVIFDELGKMRCPPGTPAANQFTDMMASNCFGVSADSIIGMAVEAAQRLVPDDERGGLSKKLANLIFDWDNSPLGRTTWYDENGNRIKNYRKWREAGNVSVGERWFVNGAKRALDELDAQDLRVSNLLDSLGIDRSDDKTATNLDLVEALEKLRNTGVTNAELRGRWDPDTVRNYVTSDLQRIPEWKSLSKEEKENLIKADIARYYETERANIEAFLDEVIKNPEHMKSIYLLEFDPTTDDEGSFSIGGVTDSGEVMGIISMNVPYQMKRQESLLPSMKPNERLKIYMEGGTTDADRAKALNDFLLNANAYATQMIGMVGGVRGSGRHTMKHEIGHSIQAAAIWKEAARVLSVDGQITLKTPKGEKIIKDLSDMTSNDVLNMMQGFSSVDLNAMNSALSRSDVVQFMAGRYVYEASTNKSPGLRMLEIGAELWALRSSGLIYGDDLDSALEYMDNVAASKITAERLTTDAELVKVVSDSYFSGIPRMIARREDAMRSSFIADKDAEVSKIRKTAKTMTQDELIDNLTQAISANAEYSAMSTDPSLSSDTDVFVNTRSAQAEKQKIDILSREWKKRYATKTGAEADEELDLLVDSIMTTEGTIPRERLEERMRKVSFQNKVEEAQTMTLEDLAQKAYDYTMLSKQPGLDEAERERMASYAGIFKNEYLNRRGSGADSIDRDDARREFQSRMKDLDRPRTEEARKIREAEREAEREKVRAARAEERDKARATREAEREAARTAKADAKEKEKEDRKRAREAKKRATPKKITGSKAAQNHGDKEREASLESATAREREALVEIGDPSTKDTGALLDPLTYLPASKAIQARNKRLKKNGITPDSSNRNEASVEEQFENIIIPTLTLLDKSSVSETVDVEIAMSLLDAKDIGDVGDELNTSGLVSGRLISDDAPHKPSSSPNGKDLEAKVIVRVQTGDRALFPTWSSDHDTNPGTQKVILPSGDFRVIEKRDDGTVVVEIASQDNSEQMLDRIVGEMAPKEGADTDYAWKKGVHSKVSKVVDRHISHQRRQGDYKKPKTSEAEIERISSDNEELISEALSSGKAWGEQISGDLPDFDEDNSILPSGIKPQTREERTDEMLSDMSDVSAVMRLSSLGASPEDIDTDDDDLSSVADLKIDPMVSEILSNSSDEEIQQIVSESAMRMHRSFDSRPRVRVREDELEDITRTGSYTFDKPDASPVEPGERLSSGRMSGMAVSKIRNRIADRVVDAVAKRTGIEGEDAREIAEIVTRTSLAFSMGPQAALAALGKELALRGSRDLAEKVTRELVERGKISPTQADFVMDKISRVAPEGLPEPIRRGVIRGAGEATEFFNERVNTPENRERVAEIAGSARESISDGAQVAKERVTEGAQAAREKARTIIAKRRLKARGSSSENTQFNPFELPPSPEDVAPESAIARITSDPFGDGSLSSGRSDMRSSTPDSSRRFQRRLLQSETPGQATTARGERVTRVPRNNRRITPVDVRENIINSSDSGIINDINFEENLTPGKLLSDKRPKGLSSGRANNIEKTLKPGSISKEPIKVKDKVIDGERQIETDVWKIGGENVVFGVPSDFDPENNEPVKIVPSNPFTLSGTELGSDEGIEIAKKWTNARTAYRESDARSGRTGSTYVDALLYAATRGDSDAEKELEELAKTGEELIQKEKELRFGNDGDNFKREVLGWSEEQIKRSRDSVDQAIASENLEDLTIDDIFLVHETTRDVPYDDDGNIALRPAGDYDDHKWDDGTPYEANRGTLHFALNHVVAPVEEVGGGRLSPKNSNVIIVRLRDVLDANPGSLDNLYAVDTFLSPPPGRPLVIPKDKMKVIKRTPDSNIYEGVKGTIEEMGGRHVFQGGEASSTRGTDAAIGRIANTMQVPSTLHSSHLLYPMERRQSMERIASRGLESARALAEAGENARARLAMRDGLMRDYEYNYVMPEGSIDI